MKERQDVWFVDCKEENLSSRTRLQFYLGKLTDKIEHEEVGTCAGIEISQDKDNADQKVKWFLKVHETYKLLWEAYFRLSFSHKFIFPFTFCKFFNFPLPP